MEPETQNQITGSAVEAAENQVAAPAKKDYFLYFSMLVSALFLGGALVYATGLRSENKPRLGGAETPSQIAAGTLVEKVLPREGVALPVSWGDLGVRLAESGVIDAEKFKALYQSRGAFTKEYQDLLSGRSNGKLKITEDNAGYLLNLFWALGLANKNPILEEGEMVTHPGVRVENFASTAGWTMARGDPMNHYSRHSLLALTEGEQQMVDRVSKNIYRPCCGNPTHFPDCNHGLAMLGLLELMASQGVSEKDMYRAALTVNSYWFPDNYLTIAAYMKNKGVDWPNVSPQEILGINYSSAMGYAKISAQVTQPQRERQGNGCGVGSAAPLEPQREPAQTQSAPGKQVSCGV